MEVRDQLHALAALSPYTLDRMLGRPQSWFGSGGKEKKIKAPARNRTPIIQPIA